MSVAFDAAGTQTAGVTTSITHTSLTVGSGSNRAAIFIVTWLGNPGAVSVNRWDDGGTNQNLETIVAPTAGIGNGGGSSSRTTWDRLTARSPTKRQLMRGCGRSGEPASRYRPRVWQGASPPDGRSVPFLRLPHRDVGAAYRCGSDVISAA